jgi:hypothetical protein
MVYIIILVGNIKPTDTPSVTNFIMIPTLENNTNNRVIKSNTSVSTINFVNFVINWTSFSFIRVSTPTAN